MAQAHSAGPMTAAPVAISAGNIPTSHEAVSGSPASPRGDDSGMTIRGLQPIDVSDLPPGNPDEPQPRTNCAPGTTVGLTGVNWPAAPPSGNMVFCSDMVGQYWTMAGGSQAANQWFFDDIELAGTDREITAITFLPYSHSTGVTFPYHVQLVLFSTPGQMCPLNDPNSVVLGTSSWATLTARYQFATVTFDPPVRVPDNDPTQPPVGNAIDFWIGFHHDLPAGSNVGLLSAACPAQVEMGVSQNLYCDETCSCPLDFDCPSGGSAFSFIWKVYATTRIGACCHRDTGVCTDNTASSNCTGVYDVFTENTTCASLDPLCTQSRGACCNVQSQPGNCTDDVDISTCLGPSGSNGNKYAEGATCVSNPFTPWCGPGACCVTEPLSSCLDNKTESECQQLGGLWKWNETCAEGLCCNRACACKGDFNLDGKVNGKDIQPFIAAVTNHSLPCSDAAWCAANMNDDDTVDFSDVQIFVTDLVNGWNCSWPDFYDCQMPDQGGD